MKGKAFSLGLSVLSVLLLFSVAAADEVWLKNEDRLAGKVVALDGGTLVFKTSYAGVKYIRFMVNQFFENEPGDRLNKELFPFAAYNAGPGRPRESSTVTSVRGAQIF